MSSRTHLSVDDCIATPFMRFYSLRDDKLILTPLKDRQLFSPLRKRIVAPFLGFSSRFMAEELIDRCTRLKITDDENSIIDLGTDVPAEMDDKLSLRLVGKLN